MKRIALLIILLAAAAVAAYVVYPDEFLHYAAEAMKAAEWVWDNVRANPVPASLAAGSFLLTVVYHKLRGKSLRESVEVAATRVTVVPIPVEPAADENPVLTRAKARATRTQLLTDQIALENRQRKLPEAITKAEKEACYTEQGVLDTERKLAERRKANDEAVARLEALRQEQDACEEELAAVAAELDKLAQLV
jgi:hypothetical protein